MPKITPMPASTLRKVFEKAGFKCVRIEGDHFVYTKKGGFKTSGYTRKERSPGICNQK